MIRLTDYKTMILTKTKRFINEPTAALQFQYCPGPAPQTSKSIQSIDHKNTNNRPVVVKAKPSKHYIGVAAVKQKLRASLANTIASR